MEKIAKNIDLNFLSLDQGRKQTFMELLMYHISNNIPLNFQKFKSFAGLSQQQWDAFKLKYKDSLKFN